MGRISRTVRYEDSLDAGIHDDICGSVVGECDEVESVTEALGDPRLGSTVDHSDRDVLSGVITDNLLAGHFLHEVRLGGIGHRPEVLGDLLQVRIGGDYGSLDGSAGPDLDDQLAGVDSGDAGNPVESEELIDGPAVVHGRGLLAVLPHDKSTGVDGPGLEVLLCDSIVPDQGVCHDEDLSLVGRVRETLLISAHSGSKNNFPDCVDLFAEQFTFVCGPIFEDQVSACHRRILRFTFHI